MCPQEGLLAKQCSVSLHQKTQEKVSQKGIAGTMSKNFFTAVIINILKALTNDCD